MWVDHTTADTELGFTTTLLLLADLHTETEKRKARAKERLEATWGENWEDEVGDLMPPWPVEEFLRGLAVFSEKHVDWAVAKTILQDRIKQQLAAKKTRKVTWLMARIIYNLVSWIFQIIDLSYIGSFRGINLNAFLRSWDFCTYREVLFGECSTRYSTQINALHGSFTLYARIQDF